MSADSKIEWTDATWNIVTGCTKVSPGCDHCYAERLTERFHGKGSFAEVVLHPERLDLPERWRKPRRVFVNSMSDLFHKDVPDDFLAQAFARMALTPRHTFQVLTKRHGRMRAVTNSADFRGAAAGHATDLIVNRNWRRGQIATTGWTTTPIDSAGYLFSPPWPLPNVHLGVSVEDQKHADLRIPVLLGTPAAARFLSCEPLLGPVNLDRHLYDHALTSVPSGGLHWVIVGGESGSGARPLELDWVRSIVNQCRDAGVPVFVKQDSGPRSGMQGRIPDELWIKEFPHAI